jgi:putative ATP-dependent endonuclease of OLD family
MHVTNVKLWNFRKFGSKGDFDLGAPNLDLDFSKGTNVLVGENDSGKSAIVDAIRYVLGTHSLDWNRISFDDFHGDTDRIRIELYLESFSDDEGKNFIEWLSWYRDENDSVKTALRLICDVRRTEERVLPYEIRAGADVDGSQLTAEAREYLKCTYLRPLRDAQAELVPRHNSRLSRIFQGHPAFKGNEKDHILVKLFESFNDEIRSYFKGVDSKGNEITDAQGKSLKDQIDAFIRAFYSEESNGLIDVSEGALKSILERLRLSIEGISNPGLGTLNRLFMAAELVHLSKPNWSGLRTALIEELEAHLHPQAQMRVVEELQRHESIQLILTSHSPNLTSKVPLSNLILCKGANAFPLGAEFTKLEADDYKFLECFLDVTKSNLFFANGVILVEGWAEELLVPALARLMKKRGLIDKDLTEAGVSVVNVGGKSYLRYAKIYLRRKGPEIGVPVSIITDLDVPEYRIVGDSVVASEAGELATKKSDAKTKALRLNEGPVRVFLAPDWTLEFSLQKSNSLRTIFEESFRIAHPNAGADNLELEVAKKLLNKGLKKQRIAYLMANAIDANVSGPNEIKIEDTDMQAQYLINGIRYACGF